MSRDRWLDPAPDVAAALGLLALAVVLRVPALGQQSLWLDDAWAALAHKADTVDELLLAGVTAPGFAAILKGWLAAVGFSSLKAQTLPFLLGVAAAPLLYAALVWRGLARVSSLCGALLLAISPTHVTVSTRVKQYTLDALVAIVLVAAVWWLLDDPRRARRWWALAVLSVAGVVLSSPAIAFVVCGFSVALLAAGRSRVRLLRVAAGPTLAAAACVGLWWAFVLRPSVNPALRDFFARQYIPTDEGLGAALEGTLSAVTQALQGLIPLPAGAVGTIGILALGVLFWRRPLLALFLALPFVLAVLLSALELAPLGTRRTDTYLFPAFAAMLAAAVHHLEKLVPRSAPLALIGAAALAFPAHGELGSYPRENIAPLVSTVEAWAGPDDGVLVYPLSNFAFGLYTTWPIDFVETDVYATGFEIRVLWPNVYVLEFHRGDPVAYSTTIDLLRSRHRVVWFIGSHVSADARAIRRQFRERGYAPTLRLRQPGAFLIRWTLGEPAGSEPSQSRKRTSRRIQTALRPSRQVIFFPSA